MSESKERNLSYDLLLGEAMKARANAYAPYSKFRVGAALLASSGKIYTGCNVENASYGASICAERTAFVKAISEGEDEFAMIAVCGGKDEPDVSCPPCGICVQVMTEFCPPDFEIVTGVPQKYSVIKLGELISLPFDKKNLG